jgi:hypothetical protein
MAQQRDAREISRSDEMSSEPSGMDGPPGMDPDGTIESNWDQVVESFDDMGLKENLLRGIYAYGFEKPSAIQQRAIVPCCKSKTLNKILLVLTVCVCVCDYV